MKGDARRTVGVFNRLATSQRQTAGHCTNLRLSMPAGLMAAAIFLVETPSGVQGPAMRALRVWTIELAIPI